VPTIDWQAVLAEHDRWLRTVVRARPGEPDHCSTDTRLTIITISPEPLSIIPPRRKK